MLLGYNIILCYCFNCLYNTHGCDHYTSTSIVTPPWHFPYFWKSTMLVVLNNYRRIRRWLKEGQPHAISLKTSFFQITILSIFRNDNNDYFIVPITHYGALILFFESTAEWPRIVFSKPDSYLKKNYLRNSNIKHFVHQIKNSFWILKRLINVFNASVVFPQTANVVNMFT